MNKENLVEEVLAKGQCPSKKAAQEAVEGLFDSIVKSLAKGEEVSIGGFGIFKVVQRKARMARNPRTGEKIQVAAQKAPRFRPSKNLKEAVK